MPHATEGQRATWEEGCAFCDILAGRHDAPLAGEGEEWLAFLDRSPLQPGHVLLVPKSHLRTLPDVPPDALAPLMEAVRRMCVAVQEAMDAEGTFVAVNNTVSQSVPHLHVHVVPRRRGDGLKGFFWPRRRYGEGEAGEVAERIRAALARVP